MAGRRGQISLTPEEVEEFLDAERTLQVASINSDGTPHLVAMWYTRHDGDIVFWTYAKSQKVVNVRRDPRLTVMVETGTKYEELKGVTIYGRARIVDDLDDVFAFGYKLYERYWGPVDSDVVPRGCARDGPEARRDRRGAGQDRLLGPRQAGWRLLQRERKRSSRSSSVRCAAASVARRVPRLVRRRRTRRWSSWSTCRSMRPARSARSIEPDHAVVAQQQVIGDVADGRVRRRRGRGSRAGAGTARA